MFVCLPAQTSPILPPQKRNAPCDTSEATVSSSSVRAPSSGVVVGRARAAPAERGARPAHRCTSSHRARRAPGAVRCVDSCSGPVVKPPSVAPVTERGVGGHAPQGRRERLLKRVPPAPIGASVNLLAGEPIGRCLGNRTRAVCAVDATAVDACDASHAQRATRRARGATGTRDAQPIDSATHRPCRNAWRSAQQRARPPRQSVSSAPIGLSTAITVKRLLRS